MVAIDSVIKGYRMLQLIIAALPIAVQAFIYLGLSIIAVHALVAVIKYFLGG